MRLKTFIIQIGKHYICVYLFMCMCDYFIG